jgi:hypothetical protein
MKIAMHTLCPVNWALAQRLARRHGHELILVEPRDPTPLDVDAAIIDLDHACPTRRQDFLHDPSQTYPFLPVAVLSYYLPRRERRALRAEGIRLFRKLKPAVMRSLAAAACPAKPACRDSGEHLCWDLTSAASAGSAVRAT